MRLSDIVQHAETKAGVTCTAFLASLPAVAFNTLLDMSSLPERFSDLMAEHGVQVSRTVGNIDSYFDALGFGIGFAGAVANKSPFKTLAYGIGTAVAPNLIHLLSKAGYQTGYTGSDFGNDIIFDSLRIGLGYALGYASRVYAQRTRSTSPSPSTTPRTVRIRIGQPIDAEIL